MIERIAEMPAGTVGLRASGKLSKGDYTKTGLRAWVRDHSAWKRFALVTDVEWVAKAMRALAWLTPGEVLVSDLDGLEDAKRWVAG